MIEETLKRLRESAQGRLEKAADAEGVKAATAELADLEGIEKEAEELKQQNASLLAAYKDIVKNEPIKKGPNDDETDNDEGQGLEFGEALKKVLDARPKN